MGRLRNHQQGEVFDEAIETFFKFWKDGRPALLNFNTHDGRAWINFSGFLGFYSASEQKEKPSIFRTNAPKSKSSPSPSKIRRNRVRAEAFREKKRKEAAETNHFSEESNSSSFKLSNTVSSSNTLADASVTSEVSFVNPSTVQIDKKSENDNHDADVTKSDKDTMEIHSEDPNEKQTVDAEEIPSILKPDVNEEITTQDSSSEEMPKENKVTEVHQEEFAFWDRKLKEKISEWHNGIKTKQVNAQNFIPLQIEFLRKVREEMGDESLFGDWLDICKKKNPQPFLQKTLDILDRFL